MLLCCLVFVSCVLNVFKVKVRGKKRIRKYVSDFTSSARERILIDLHPGVGEVDRDMMRMRHTSFSPGGGIRLQSSQEQCLCNNDNTKIIQYITI